MKLVASAVAALVSWAATTAAQQDAEVFMIPAVDSSSPPAIIPGLARLILLHRLSSSGRGISSLDIPNVVEMERALSIINQFGKATAPLFSDQQANQPSQLVVMLDGMSDEQIKGLRNVIGMAPTLTIADPPAAEAHKELVELDLRRAGAADGNRCSIQQLFNPLEECWGGSQSAVAKYSLQNNPELVEQLAKQLTQVQMLAKSGDMYTTIVALPATKSKARWSNEAQELRRRQAEHVLDQTTSPAEASSPATPAPILFASPKRIPSCFDSLSACSEATRNCTGHGQCQDRYASGGDGKGNAVCFSCHCQATKSERGSLTHWAGSSCAKQDVSVPFWLFAGFTVILIGILSLSIGLLFNVGEEKLPGVIGAGVSRSK